MVFQPRKIPHPRRQGPSTYKAILLDHPQQSVVWTRCGHPRSLRGLAWQQISSGSKPQEDVVDGSLSQTYATSNSTLPHALMGKHFMPNTYGVGDALLEQSVRIEKKYAIDDSNLPQCEGRFGEMTT